MSRNYNSPINLYSLTNSSNIQFSGLEKRKGRRFIILYGIVLGTSDSLIISSN